MEANGEKHSRVTKKKMVELSGRRPWKNESSRTEIISPGSRNMEGLSDGGYNS
jgi:hypothetical protein